jgi:hypothetical protein
MGDEGSTSRVHTFNQMRKRQPNMRRKCVASAQKSPAKQTFLVAVAGWRHMNRVTARILRGAGTASCAYSGASGLASILACCVSPKKRSLPASPPPEATARDFIQGTLPASRLRSTLFARSLATKTQRRNQVAKIIASKWRSQWVDEKKLVVKWRQPFRNLTLWELCR